MINIPAAVQTEIDAGSLFVINHSGGKDSQAMTALLADLLPANQVLVVHAELPEADWAGIPQHIESTIPAGWPVEYTVARDRDGNVKTFFDMVERRHQTRPDVPSFPSASTRQCTSDLKRGPIDKVVRAYVKANPQFRGRVVHCVGIRAQESTSRAKAATWTVNKRESKAGRQVFTWLPIHDMLEEQVFATIAAAGQQPHFAYGLGMSRLSCSFCILGNKRDLQTAARHRPDLYARYVELEERTGYTMKANVSLEQFTGIRANRKVIPIRVA